MSNKQLIAKIKLALGQIGFYDETSGVYLTQQNPSANIYAGTNCIRLSEAVKENKLILVEGTLVPSRVKQILKIKQEILKADKDITDDAVANDIPDTKTESQEQIINTVNEDITELKDESSTENIKSTDTAVDEVNYIEETQKDEIIITIDGENLTDIVTLTVGESKVVEVNADNITLKSSATSVVSITKKGKMTARGEGEAYIYAVLDNEEKSLFNVVVNAAESETN